MHHQITRIHQSPFAAVAFGTEDFKTRLFQIDCHVVGQSFDLPAAIAAGNNHAGKQGGFVLGFQNGNVFGFHVFQGRNGDFDHFLQILQFLFCHHFFHFEPAWCRQFMKEAV